MGATEDASAPALSGCAFNIQLAESGGYRLHFEDLVAAGAAAVPPAAVLGWPSDHLHLTWRGETAPIAVVDGGDGTFGPGDSFEWVGKVLHGENSYFDELTRMNVYRLDACGKAAKAARTLAMPDFEPKLSAGSPATLRVKQHFEQDRLLLRFNEKVAHGENWYWTKMTQVDEQPFVLPINLRLYDPEAGSMALKLNLRGWSHRSGRRHNMPDHAVEVLLNGTSLGIFNAELQDPFMIELPKLPADLIQSGINQLAIRVPPRAAPDGTTIVDAILLNWVELEFPRRQVIDAQQDVYLEPADPGSKGPRWMVLRATEPGALVVLDDTGRRWHGKAIATDSKDGKIFRHRLNVPAESRRLTIVPAEHWRRPVAVELDQPSDWLARAPQTDYLMVVHPTLHEAILPLAEFHRARGLKVSVVDVRDVFDEVNFGLRHPRAIRDFVGRAWREWPEPKPRWVLLVGDASWDSRAQADDDSNYADWTYQPGETNIFLKNGMIPYADAGQKNRDLIPAWPENTSQGHAASDNYFVAIDGDDALPEMAIGRFPVVSPEEVTAIVEKIKRYSRAESAAWQKSAIFITNEEESFKKASDRIAATFENVLEVQKVYPAATESSNDQNTASLLRSFDDGKLLVHFLGHGGRYIWRTGPPDYRKNHDLFTLDDLEKLVPNDKLPMILSMTCYSGPFDHPSADSIGEKFLRLADRGAIAVLAASWRNSPTEDFSRSLISGLLRPGTTIGEAIREAKLGPGVSRDCIEQYNLFGDPAISLALPIPSPPTATATQPEPTVASEKSSSR